MNAKEKQREMEKITEELDYIHESNYENLEILKEEILLNKNLIVNLLENTKKIRKMKEFQEQKREMDVLLCEIEYQNERIDNLIEMIDELVFLFNCDGVEKYE